MAIIKSETKTPVQANIKSSVRAQEFRDGLTRVGITSKPIKGEDTQAKQWNRWTP